MAIKEILIVEDAPEMQARYQSMISTAFDVRIVQRSNGLEALKAVDQHRPDLIILDLLMPVMDGEEFLRQLRHGRKMDIPVVVCSVNQERANELLKRNEVEGVLPKFFTSESLVELLSKFLDSSPKKKVPGS